MNCELAPVVCRISTKSLETVYCQDCIDALALANHRVHKLEPPEPEKGDLELLDRTEARLKKLIDSGDWKPRGD